MTDLHYTIHGAAELLGIHKDTLRRYERLGLITPARETHQYRLYLLSGLKALCERIPATKGLYFDVLPQVRHKDVYCSKCMREWKRGELWDIEIAIVCPRCRQCDFLTDIIH